MFFFYLLSVLCSRSHSLDEKDNLQVQKTIHVHRKILDTKPQEIQSEMHATFRYLIVVLKKYQASLYVAHTFPRTGAIPMITEARADRTCCEESDDNSWKWYM